MAALAPTSLTFLKGMYVSDTTTQQDPAITPAAPTGGNGFAITSLVTGILSIWPLGLIFGILGLFRAKKVGKGKVMSWIGIILSIVWLAGYIYVTPHLVKLADPGCQAAIKVHNNYPDSKVNKDGATNPQAFGADLQAEIVGFTSAANKAKNATAKKDMQAEVADLTAVLTAAAAGQQPSAAVVAKTNSDEDAITKACGGF
jgi:hypothetical protein